MRLVKRALIFVHRWLGVALCLLFLLWFPSGIVMMYWPFPDVSAADRLERAAPLESQAIELTPAEAIAALRREQPAADAAALGEIGIPQVRLNTFDGRPVYRVRAAGQAHMVYADSGEIDPPVTPDVMRRMAARWSGQPAGEATGAPLEAVDQWTVQNFRSIAPVWKFSWPDGQQVYVSETTGEVVQATTRASRMWAYLGAIPHWFYFTPLRTHGPIWSRVVIWSSAVGTMAAILGLVIAAWMYSPRKRYRHAGVPTSIPYRGQKRLHTIFGLLFGVSTVTWAFSGMLSMEPFPLTRGDDEGPAPPQLRGRAAVEPFQAKHPRAAIAQLPDGSVKELELISFAGEPVYLVTLSGGDTRVVPLEGGPREAFDRARIVDLVQRQAAEYGPADVRLLEDYDRYYLDRERQAPLPVLLVSYRDTQQTRFYIDPATARVVGGYASGDWMRRWLYHGLHSLDFPWLYRYRPLWDIVVITLLTGGTALCVTSAILAWRVLGRKLRAIVPAGTAAPALGDDLA